MTAKDELEGQRSCRRGRAAVRFGKIQRNAVNAVRLPKVFGDFPALRP
jgi:hypothetical protein